MPRSPEVKGTDTTAVQMRKDMEFIGNVGFYGVSAVAQPADVGALTDSSGGTTDNTVSDVGVSFDQATLNNNFAEVVENLNAIRTVLRDLGLMA